MDTLLSYINKRNKELDKSSHKSWTKEEEAVIEEYLRDYPYDKLKDITAYIIRDDKLVNRSPDSIMTRTHVVKTRLKEEHDVKSIDEITHQEPELHENPAKQEEESRKGYFKVLRDARSQSNKLTMVFDTENLEVRHYDMMNELHISVDSLSIDHATLDNFLATLNTLDRNTLSKVKSTIMSTVEKEMLVDILLSNLK